jgi:hypothetical protein
MNVSVASYQKAAHGGTTVSTREKERKPKGYHWQNEYGKEESYGREGSQGSEGMVKRPKGFGVVYGEERGREKTERVVYVKNGAILLVGTQTTMT